MIYKVLYLFFWNTRLLNINYKYISNGTLFVQLIALVSFSSYFYRLRLQKYLKTYTGHLSSKTSSTFSVLSQGNKRTLNSVWILKLGKRKKKESSITNHKYFVYNSTIIVKIQRLIESFLQSINFIPLLNSV